MGPPTPEPGPTCHEDHPDAKCAAAHGARSTGRRVGGWIFVSALFGVHGDTGQPPKDSSDEAAQLFENLTAVLAAAGAQLTDVVRVGIFMKDLQRDRPVFNEMWVKYFRGHRPARFAVQAADFGPPTVDLRYMVEAVARREP